MFRVDSQKNCEVDYLVYGTLKRVNNDSKNVFGYFDIRFDFS